MALLITFLEALNEITGIVQLLLLFLQFIGIAV